MIEIPEEARVWALKREQEIQASAVVRNTENYTGFSAPLRYTKGSIGEWAFRHYLDSLDVHYKTDDPVGKSDKLDFLVHHDIAGPLCLDVKTSYDDELKVNQRQAERKKPDGYVLVQRNPELTRCEIIGYISRKLFFKICEKKSFANGGDAFVVARESLRGMEELIPHLSRGSKSWRFAFEGGEGTMILPRAVSKAEAHEAVLAKFGREPGLLEPIG